MKKLFILFLILNFTVLGAFAKPKLIYRDGQNFIKNITTPQSDDYKAIRNLLSDLHKYSNSSEIDKIKNLYSKDFKNSDNFDYDTFFNLYEKNINAYTNMEYSNIIKNITISNNQALVELREITKGNLKKDDEALGQNNVGILEGVCDYVLYLIKQDDKWYITSDYVIFEETSLKYGEAKNLNMKFDVPLRVKSGDNYTMALELEYPKDTFVLTSLAKEEIIYPTKEKDETYRKLPQSGMLERIVRANTNQRNEYAIASVGLTKIVLDKKRYAKINFEMSGMAFIMKRVNVINDAPHMKGSSK